MDEARLAKLKHRATQAIESARGDGFAELVLELLEEMRTGNLPNPSTASNKAQNPTPQTAQEMEVDAELDPTPKRKRKVAEAGGDLSGSD